MLVRSVLYSIFIPCFSITLSADSIYESQRFEMMDCVDIDTTICSGEVFEFESQTFDETGTYSLTSNNCDGMFTLSLTVTPKPADEVTNAEMCEGQIYVVAPGVEITESVIYRIENDGCTADDVLNLTVIPKPDDVITNVTICEGQSYYWYVTGEIYTVSGIYLFTSHICEADEILILTIPITGSQPPEACFGEVEYDETTCLWDVEGYYPVPYTECYETAFIDPTTCLWVVTGEIPEEPVVECYETPTFNNLNCSWEVNGQLPSEPPTHCWQIAQFNETSCLWDSIGVMPTNPYPGCYIFNEEDCQWQPEGIPDINDIQECNQIINILDDCMWEIIGGEMCNYVTGEITLDQNLDGCDLNDPSVANANIHNAFYSTFSSTSGRYSLHTDLDSMIIGIDSTRCDIIYPKDTIIYFDDSNVQTLDFCLPSISISDARLALCPLAGNPNGYFIMINNYGAIPISGEVTLQAEQTLIDSSVPPVTSELDNLFTWEFEEIEPYGEMRIEFILSFDESLMIGDQVAMIATVTIDQLDKNLVNNEIIKTKTINSLTSNLNTTALVQGSPLPPSAIGEYVDLVIIFENEESKGFTNSIVLRDTLNTDFFDVTSFEPLLFSHECTVDLCDGNKLSVEFDDNVPNGENGFFAYRIKLSDDLEVGDTITSQATIYIDFNPPILADPAIAVISIPEISNTENMISKKLSLDINPNPTQDIFTVTLDQESTSTLISIYNDRGQLMTTQNSDEQKIQFDSSEYPVGVYVVKVQVGDEVVSRKLVVVR